MRVRRAAAAQHGQKLVSLASLVSKSTSRRRRARPKASTSTNKVSEAVGAEAVGAEAVVLVRGYPLFGEVPSALQ